MINNFINERFPEDISFGAVGGPEYKTDIVVTASGKEYRGIGWQTPKLKYNVAYGIKNQQQMEALLAFFRGVKGKAVGFRFKDWSDYTVSSTIIGAGDGKKSIFQLIKKYQYKQMLEKRTITKPVVDTLKIYVNENIYTSDNYRVDYNKGIVEFLHPPETNTTISASFEFDVPVRFDVDHLAITLEEKNVYSFKSINLIEIKA